MAVAIARQPRSDPVLQFTIFIPNRIGRLHEVARLLYERAVHILALTVLDTTDSTILRLIVDDPDSARGLLQKHAFAFTETSVVVVEMQGERQLPRCWRPSSTSTTPIRSSPGRAASPRWC
jgi:hypothetical protein